jgi:hypothetical protein
LIVGSFSCEDAAYIITVAITTYHMVSMCFEHSVFVIPVPVTSHSMKENIVSHTFLVLSLYPHSFLFRGLFCDVQPFMLIKALRLQKPLSCFTVLTTASVNCDKVLQISDFVECLCDSECIVSAVLSQYFKYVSSLGFETKPDYTFCRNLLRQGIEDSGYLDDGKLVFGASPCRRIIKNKKVRYSLYIFVPKRRWKNIR